MVVRTELYIDTRVEDSKNGTTPWTLSFTTSATIAFVFLRSRDSMMTFVVTGDFYLEIWSFGDSKTTSEPGVVSDR